MAINLDKKHPTVESGLGKYAGVHGVIRKTEVAAASPHKGISGKGVVGGNYPMDSDKEFEKRVKRYQRQQREAAESAAQAAAPHVIPASKMASIPA